jgi:hypothetical protein
MWSAQHRRRPKITDGQRSVAGVLSRQREIR